MKTLKLTRISILLCCALIFFQLREALCQPGNSQASTTGQSALVERDGQHDFDFEIGSWKSHVKRLERPFTGSTSWLEYDGTTVVRKIWDGRANLSELEADGPAGHLEALSLRLYSPQAHQWSLGYATSRGGMLGTPSIGEFKNDRGEFFDTESIDGRSVLVRQVWSDTTPSSCRFEQAFSTDGGKTWEVNWITTSTRENVNP